MTDSRLLRGGGRVKTYWDPRFTRPLSDHDKRVIALHEQLHRDFLKLRSRKVMTDAEKADYNRKTDAAVEQVLRDV